MKLYVVRHAIAVDHGTPGVSEEDRPLTPEGIRKMKKAASGLKALDAIPKLILSSPLPRSMQTAEILRNTLGVLADIAEVRALAPGGERDDVYEEIRKRRDGGDLMLVGHQPSLGELVGEIAFRSPGCYVELRKGGACAVEMERLSPTPRGTLLWLVPSSILRKLK
jgi:phosphohistidine phosphatase